MKSLALAGALSLALGLTGCLGSNDIATIDAAIATLNGASVSPRQIYVAGNLFVGLEKTATNYLRLPPCPKAAICRDPAAVKVIDPAVRSGAAAAKQLVAYARSPSGPVPVSAYAVVVTAAKTLQSAFAQYGLAGGQ